VAQPLGDLETAPARHQRHGLVALQVVQRGALLAGDLEQVAKALGRDQAGSTAATLDQGVGGTVVPWPK
jgi:hypothetical protein